METTCGNHICGLYWTTPSRQYERTYLPQVQLKSRTTITPFCFTTQITQCFHNSSQEMRARARYTFPLYDGVAINRYTISYGDEVLYGVVKQKNDAKETYDVAVSRGETAGLLEQLPIGVFGVTLGNLPARTDVTVEITYCGELKHDAAIDGLRYNLPTSIAPRYGEHPGAILHGNTIAEAGISITVDMDMAGSAVRKVQSPSHPIAISMGATSADTASNQAPYRPSQASATLSLGSTELAQDFILQIVVDDISKPQAILETHPTIPNHRAIMTTLVPKFNLPSANPEIVFLADQSYSMHGWKNRALVSALRVFLKSLPFGVRFNLCAFGETFTFLWPSSQPYSEENLGRAMAFADNFTGTMSGTEILNPIVAAFKQRLADLPLEVMLLTDGEVFSEEDIFHYVNAQVHGEKANARVFALGIGGDVSHSFVEGVARAGNGFAQFVTEHEETYAKVVRMLKGALFAHTDNYEIEVHSEKQEGDLEGAMETEEGFEILEKVRDCMWLDDGDNSNDATGAERTASASEAPVKSFFDDSSGGDRPGEKERASADRYAHLPRLEYPKILQSPSEVPPLFPFNRTTLYILLDPEAARGKVTSVTLRVSSAHGPLALNIPVHQSNANTGTTIHQLAARNAVRELEEGRGWLQLAKVKTDAGEDSTVREKYASRFDELVEREAVRLGEKFAVVGKWTSFVAVQEGRKGEAEETSDSGIQDLALQGNKRYANIPAHNFVTPPHHEIERASRFGSDGPRGAFSSVGTAFGTSSSSFSAAGKSVFGTNKFSSGDFERAHRASSSHQGTQGSLLSRDIYGNQQGMNTTHPTATNLFGNGRDTSQRPQLPFESNRVLPSLHWPNIPAPGDIAGGLLGSTSTGRPSKAAEGSAFGSTIQHWLTDAFGRERQFTASPAVGYAFSNNTAAMPLPGDKDDDLCENSFDFDMGFALMDDGDIPQIEAMKLQSQDERDAISAPQPPPAPWSALYSFLSVKMANVHGIRIEPASVSSGRVANSGFSPEEEEKGENKTMSSKLTIRNESDVTSTAMYALIDMQTFSGAWGWSGMLFDAISVEEKKVDRSDLVGNSDAQICATAIAIAFLEMKAASKKDVWEMVVSKARTWLEKRLGGEESVMEVVCKAGKYL